MKLQDRQRLGEDIAALVLAAERKYPAPGSGRLRMQYCVREARKRAAGDGQDTSSAEAAKWFGGMVLRLAIEVSVASINAYRRDKGL